PHDQPASVASCNSPCTAGVASDIGSYQPSDHIAFGSTLSKVCSTSAQVIVSIHRHAIVRMQLASMLFPITEAELETGIFTFPQQHRTTWVETATTSPTIVHWDSLEAATNYVLRIAVTQSKKIQYIVFRTP